MSLLDQVTPIVITWNEEPNIKRVFDQLTWARDVLVVDSGSVDGTLGLLAAYPNVRVLTHPFRSFAEQWNFSLDAGEIKTPWVMTLDADYVLGDALLEELKSLEPPAAVSGYSTSFVYRSLGRPLRGSLYPPRTVLFRHRSGRFEQEGHQQRLVVEGEVAGLSNSIFHDDRKPLARWLANQEGYATLEARRLGAAEAADLDWADRVRRTGCAAPALVAVYCLFWKGCVLDGGAGLYYTFQRVIAEALLAMRLWEMRISRE